MKSLLLFLSFMLCLNFQAEAQFGKKLRDKLAEKFGTKEQPVEDKKEEDNTEEEAENEEYPDIDISSMFGGGEPVELEESYEYNFSIDWTITSSQSDEPTDMTQLFSTEYNYMGMKTATDQKDESKKMTMIIDVERSYMIALDQDENQALVTSFQNATDQVVEQAEMEDETKVTIEKTNETKMVAGYLCTKYIYKSEDSSGEFWTTVDLNYKNFNIFEYFQKMSRRNNDVRQNSLWQGEFEGFMLHVTGTDSDGETFDMIATSVDENAKVTYKMSDYEVMNLTNLPTGGYPGGRRN